MKIPGGLEAIIQVDGVALPEFDDDDDDQVADPTIVKKYVEAQSGKNFGVLIKATRDVKINGGDYLNFAIYLDGRGVQGCVILAEDLERKPEATAFRSASHVHDGAHHPMQRDFRFADIHLDDSLQQLEVLTDKYEYLGEIRIVARRKTLLSVSDDGIYHDPDNTARKVPEKAIKGRAISLSSMLGELKKANRMRTVLGRDIDKEPCATFIFKYRSKRDLQAMLIVPRSLNPSLERQIEERDLDTLTREEAIELLRRKRREISSIPNVKTEEQLRVKRELQCDDVQGQENDNNSNKRHCRSNRADATISIDNDSDDDDAVTFLESRKTIRDPNRPIDIIDHT